MEDNQFKAILAKNDIARHLAGYKTGFIENLNLEYLVEALNQIENYIGEANQPNVGDIFNHNSNPNNYPI
jgi:hypothetical protein